MTSAEARAAAAEAREAAAEHEDALQALALRTPPLGADRHHRTYWWPLGERLCGVPRTCTLHLLDAMHAHEAGRRKPYARHAAADCPLPPLLVFVAAPCVSCKSVLFLRGSAIADCLIRGS